MATDFHVLETSVLPDKKTEVSPTGELPVDPSRPRIIVVGLGPSVPGLLTAATLEAIAATPHRLLRTAIHPAASAVPEAENFDHLYERAGSFAEVYEAVVTQLLKRALDVGEVLYAVPGSPAVAEHTVELLLARAPGAGVKVEVIPALSFADLAWVRLGVDPLAETVTLIDGHRFTDDIAGRRGPFLVAQCHSNVIMSDVKLALSEAVADPSDLPEITILHHLGLPDERVVPVHWSKLDQSVPADHLTSLYVPELSRRVGPAADRLWTLMQHLRVACPWNAEQTVQSLAPYAIEEAHELVEAIAELGDPESYAHVAQDLIADYRRELGDVLYQVLFHAMAAHDEGWFSFEDVISGLQDKLVYRHPHLFPRDDFDPGAITSSDDVVRNWERIKAMERWERGAGPQ